MKALSLFSGIGGLDLAAEAAGIQTIAMCEIDPFCREILALRFHDIPIIEDVRSIQGDEFKGVDVIHGGFPCQDLSSAGPQEGLEGERSKLWFEMLRIVGNARPRYVVAENVYNAVNLALDRIVGGLESEGYKVWPVVLPASAFGAPHERKRLCVFAIRGDAADAKYDRRERWSQENEKARIETANSVMPFRENLWPTPTVRGNHNRKGLSKNAGDGLATAVRLWMTPKASDSYMGRTARQSDRPAEMTTQLQSQIYHVEGRQPAGQLNPDWVECLMGYPIGWTNPDCENPQEWPGFPMPPGFEQYDYEPPRLTDRREHRVNRIKVSGNAVMRQQFEPVFQVIQLIDEAVRTGD